MDHRTRRRLGWHLVTVLILAALAWGLVQATQRLNYQWTWNRVPQYFIFAGEVDLFAEADGTVEAVLRGRESTRLTLRYSSGLAATGSGLTATGAGQTVTLAMSAGSVSLEEGDPVGEGDLLGTQHVVQRGLLVIGLITTLEISLYAGLLGLSIGLVSGLARVAAHPTLRALAAFYVELIRGTPLLVQIFIFYFFIGTVLDLSRFTAGVLALALFAGAYVAEIVRAGIQSVPRGQVEAAHALGMSYAHTTAFIVLPQAVRAVLPALAGQFISLIKDSSLVSVIAITDLTKAGREVIANTFATFEIWFTVAAMYFLLTFTLSLFTKYLERRFEVGK